MEKPLKFDETVKAIKLITGNCKARPDLKVQIVGWGAMNWDLEKQKAFDYPKTLKLGEYKLLSLDECGNMLCSGPLSGNSSPFYVSFNDYLHLMTLLPEGAYFYRSQL